MKYSSGADNNTANKTEFKENTQGPPKTIARTNRYKPWIDQFVTKQLGKIKQLAAVHSGKDEMEKVNEQYTSSNKETMHGLCEETVQDVIKHLINMHTMQLARMKIQSTPKAQSSAIYISPSKAQKT